MIKSPQRLIEVDLPIGIISKQSRSEKAVRQGHISSLHIWWARRPLTACRAVLCATIWPDPVDPDCPQAFRQIASIVIGNFAEQVKIDSLLAGLCKEHWSRWSRTTYISLQFDNPAFWPDLRYALLDFIADFSSWEASAVPQFLIAARILTKASYVCINHPEFCIPGNLQKLSHAEIIDKLERELAQYPSPVVIDPFAGGGAIPIEASRIGADAFASDLNPVAVLLNKVALEFIPKYGRQLADEVRKMGDWVRENIEIDLREFYPSVKISDDNYHPSVELYKKGQSVDWKLISIEQETPITYIWARTLKCEAPGCGTEVPIVRSLWLAKKAKHSIGLRIVPDQKNKAINFEIVEKAKDISEGTVRRGSVTCPVCGYTTPVDRVRIQLREKHGGANGARLIAVACTIKTRRSIQNKNMQQVFEEVGRYYRLPTDQDLFAVDLAVKKLEALRKENSGKVSLTPNEPLPLMSGVFNAPIYGHTTWDSLYTPRQLLALVTIVKYVKMVSSKYGEDLGKAVQTLLAFALDKQADLGNSLNRWEPIAECPRQLFGRQAIPMIWDFAEGVPLGETSGGFIVFVDGLAKALENLGSSWQQGHVEKASATNHPLPDDMASYVFTDPPYYNAVPYADLSDFFYLWLRRTVGDLYPDLFDQPLAPKDEEICEMAGWDPVRYPYKDSQWFVEKMTLAMSEARRVLSPGGLGVVVFAHKSTSGWESQIQAMIDAGWTITSSWPIDTENTSRLRAQGSAALASSVHLVCRPRETASGELIDKPGDWRDVLGELPGKIHSWLPRLANEGVVGADAIFACLGPALEIFSRYSRVEKASGEQVSLKQYLEVVWAAVSREALSMIFEGADATGFEEDARLTAMWLWTLKTESNGISTESQEKDQLMFDSEEENEESSGGKEIKTSGFELEYDAARKISQGLGVHLERLDGLVVVKSDKARLLPVSERARALFGKDDDLYSDKRKKKIDTQMGLFNALDEIEAQEGDWGDKKAPKAGVTTLDRLHQVMLLFASGRNEAIKRFLIDEGVGKDNRFWRLAQALSALYPSGTDEKRWVDGVLAKKKGLGF